MNVARIFAQVAIRKLAYLAVAAIIGLVLSLCGTGKAHAQTQPPNHCTSEAACDQGQAYAECESFKTYTMSVYTGYTYHCGLRTPSNPNDRVYQCGEAASGSGSPCLGQSLFPFHNCVAPKIWDVTTHTCKGPDAECSSKPNRKDFGIHGDAGNACADGCEFVVDAATVNHIGSGSSKLTTGNFSPTGYACSVADPIVPIDPDKQTCQTLAGGFGECVKPNGDHCFTQGGLTLCWKSTITGPKLTQDGTLGGDRTIAPTAPTAPPNQKTPSPQVSTTTTINGTTYNTLITTGSGTNGPGQPNTGLPGDSNGDGKKDGNDDGNGSDDEDGGGAGSAGGGVGDLYESNGDTIGEAFEDFKSRVSDAPLIDAAGNFFDVPASGTCPVWTVPATHFWPTLTLDLQCNPPVSTALEACGYVLLALAAFCAFRIALY